MDFWLAQYPVSQEYDFVVNPAGVLRFHGHVDDRSWQQGKNASEAGYMVGYNSPAQFSRGRKRYFGYTPSATLGVA